MPRPKRKPVSKSKRDYSELRVLIPIIAFFVLLGGLAYWASRRQAQQERLTPLRVAGPAWIVESPAFADAKRNFEQRQPESVIETKAADGPALIEKITARKPADLAVGLTREQAAAVAGRVIAWDDFFDTHTARADFIGAFLADATAAKGLVMMPFVGDGVFLLTRPKWLADAGVAAPFETWYQLTVAAAKLTKGTSRYGMAVDWGEANAGLSYASAMQARGAAIAPAARSLKSAAALDALRFWSDLVSGGLCSKDTVAGPPAARKAFVEGRAAILWTVASARQEATARLGPEEVGCAALPGSEAHGTAIVTYGAVIPTASKQRDLAQRFVRDHLLSEPFQRALAESAMRLPTLRRNYANLKGGEWQMILRVLQRGAGAKPHDLARLDRVLVQDLTPAITGSTPPNEALAQAAKDMAGSAR